MPMNPSGLNWWGIEVRLIVPSPEAHTPIVHHWLTTLRPAALARASCISTWIQVPSGVVAFHEATNSSNSNPGENQGEVHEPDSNEWPLKRPSGSVPLMGAGPIRRPAPAPITSEDPSMVPLA